MIQVRNFQKAFDGRRVVDRICFDAADGAITGLLGANGAGKTTILRMISGLLEPDAGSIAVDRQQLGALLDHTGIYPRLTVRENLEYFGRLRGMPRERLDARVDETIRTLGLESLRDRRTAGFSQGERTKVALGRALLHSPRDLLLDEPTNALDVLTVRSLRDLLQRLRDSGVCVVFSSHVLEEVRSLCDKVVMISQGAVAAEGTPEELCAQAGAADLEEAFIRLTVERENALC